MQIANVQQSNSILKCESIEESGNSVRDKHNGNMKIMVERVCSFLKHLGDYTPA